MSPIASQLADFVTALYADGPGDALIADVTGRLIDVAGNSLAATYTAPAVAARQLLPAWGSGSDCHVYGWSKVLPATSASFYGGTVAHALDFDDTHFPSILHPSACVIPAVLAVGQTVGASGANISAAIVAGIEVATRIGMGGYEPGTETSVFFERGFHAAAICGAIGAAVAATVLSGGNVAEIEAAIGISASFGSGLLEANRTGGSVKRIHCGWAAHAGVAAAHLALAGLTGPPTVIEGRFGLLAAFCGADRVNLPAVTAELGTRWEILRTGYKPYPTNVYTHPGVDAALELRRRGIIPTAIKSVEIAAPSATLRTIAEPWEEKVAPNDPYTAAFSGPFTFATALFGGGGLGVYLSDFTEATVADPARRALAAKVRYVSDDEVELAFPRRVAARVRVSTYDGAEQVIEVMVNRGHPDNPLSLHELRQKFIENASTLLGPELAAAALARIEMFPSVRAKDLVDPMLFILPLENYCSAKRKKS